MNVIVEWLDGRPATTYESVERLGYVDTELSRGRPIPTFAIEPAGDAGALYLNLAAVRSIRYVQPSGANATEIAQAQRDLADRTELRMWDVAAAGITQ